MSRTRCPWARGLSLTLAVALAAAAPSRAAEVDRFLPDDTEIVVSINVKQLLDSELVKKYALEKARDALKDNSDIEDVLRDLGFDPFKDLDQILVASPTGGESDRGLLIVHGRFDLAKFKAKGDEAARDHPDVLKIHKVPDGLGGRNLVYEVLTPGPNGNETSIFVALAGKDTLLASPGKDYVVDALKKAGPRNKATLKDRELQALLEQMNPKQSLAVAAAGSALAKAELPGEVKAALDKVHTLGGGITVEDGVKLEFTIGARDADAAKELNKTLNDGLKQALLLATAVAAANEDLNALLDVVKSVKVGVKDKVLTVKAAIDAEVVEKALKKDR
jgi:hypothetical protein